MQMMCIKQELMNMKVLHRPAHKGIIYMALAINQAKHIAVNLKVEDKLKMYDELAENLALKLPQAYSKEWHRFLHLTNKDLTQWEVFVK